MQNDFTEHMFVSIPLLVPDASAPTRTTLVAAIANVNADIDVEDGWRRAYHKEWLDVLIQRAAPFIEIAFYAAMLKLV